MFARSSCVLSSFSIIFIWFEVARRHGAWEVSATGSAGPWGVPTRGVQVQHERGRGDCGRGKTTAIWFVGSLPTMRCATV
jgi:hypothetical protein